MSVQPRAHKNFRLRRARQQPLSDVSRAGKQVWTGQKTVSPKLILSASLYLYTTDMRINHR